MLRTRLLTAAVALPLLIFLIHSAPEWGFSSAILVLTGVGLYEYFSLTRAQCSLSPVIGGLWGMLVALSMLSGDARLIGAALTLGFMLVFILSLRDRQPARGIQTTSLCVLGVVYIGFLFPHLLWIHRGPEGAGWIFFILLVAMLGDTGGYVVGRIWGKRKLLPHISPSKTIEGSVGSIGGNCVAALVAWQYLLPNRSALELVLLALLMGVLAQLGDLCESALKRACGAKDSGRLFPGHGGVLDRIDSLLFPGAFIYYYNTLWH